MGEAAFDELHGGGKVGGGEEEVDVVGHDDEGVEFVVAFAAVVLEGFEESSALAGSLKRRRRL